MGIYPRFDIGGDFFYGSLAPFGHILLRYFMDDFPVYEVELLFARVGNLFVVLQFVVVGTLPVRFPSGYRYVFYIHVVD